MLQSPEDVEAATDHVLATAEAFTMEGHVTAELDGNPNAQQLLARRLQAWDLRIDGYTYREIGQRLSVHPSTAYLDVQSAAELLDDYRKAKAEKVLEIELARLDKVRRVAQDDAVNLSNKQRHKAQLAYARLQDIINKMLGLNAPEQHQVVGMVLTEQQLASSRSSLDEKLEQLRQRMVGGVVQGQVVDVTPSTEGQQ